MKRERVLVFMFVFLIGISFVFAQEICTDSDDGKDYFFKGNTCIGENCKSDICSSGSIYYDLIEYYCQTLDDRGDINYKCPNGCEDGACVGPDATPPQILDAGPSGLIVENSPIMWVSTNENSICRYSDKNIDYNKMTTFFKTGELNHLQPMTFIDGEYTFYVKCMDSSGNLNSESFIISFVIDSQVYCCEKVIGGEWCRNDAKSNCDSDFRQAPISCERTPYCILGICRQDNSCAENVPKVLCENQGGIWEDKLQCQGDLCMDNDGGKNYYIKGYTEQTNTSYGVLGTGDLCEKGEKEGYVREYYCEGSVKMEEYYKCPNGCKDGACIRGFTQECTDSDDGRDYYVKGFVFGKPVPSSIGIIGLPISVNDTCKDNKLTEYYCEDNYVYSVEHSCSFSCKGGVCIKKEGETEIISPTEETEPIEIPEETTEIVYLCNGCELDNKCYPFGYRKKDIFCSESFGFVEQKKEDSSCHNNFECKSNVCVSDKCISANLIQEIINWFKKLFGVGEEPSSETQECTDSDDGKDYFFKGNTCIGENCKSDICSSGSIYYDLREYYCQTLDDRGDINYKCPNGCKDGACIRGLTQELKLSKLKCGIDPKTGKESNCSCIVNQNKNKFTVIIKKNGVLDNNIIKQKLNLFLDSVKNDLNIDNIGISYFDGNSIPELDMFIEELYHNEDVGYVTVIGDELDLLKIEKGPSEALDFDLSLVGKEWNLPRNEQGIREINPDAYCREVAISWILPPMLYTDNEKIDFIAGVLDRYTKYHNNENNILNQYQDDYLHIQWENGHTNLGTDLSMSEKGYIKDKVLIWNHEHDKIETELEKKHYLLYYNVHGSPIMIGLGLNPNDETNEYSAVYTKLDEFSEFVEQTGTPALLVQAGSCGSVVTGGISYDNNKNCCWPQRFLNAGTWAYYAIGGGGDRIYNMEKLFSTEPFFGHAIRNNPIGQYIIFGDITAHFRS